MTKLKKSLFRLLFVSTLLTLGAVFAAEEDGAEGPVSLAPASSMMADDGKTVEQDVEGSSSVSRYKSDSESGRFPVVLIVPIVVLFVSIAYFMNQKK